MNEKVIQILSNVCELSISDIEKLDDSTQLDSLGFTSIKFVELIVELENELNIEFNEGDLFFQKFKTLGQLNSLVSLYLSLNSSPTKIKCIVLDCDDVLWKGVAGEEPIAADNDVLTLQKILVDLKKKGVLLALCSKNNIENLQAAFSMTSMLLSWNDIVAVRANMIDKPTNIKEIVEELNFSLDSVLYLDNSEYELGLIGEFLPEVFSLHVDYSNMIFVQKLEILSGLMPASELDRTQMFIEQKNRQKERGKFSSIEEYNSSLNTFCDCGVATYEMVERLTELSRRTNKFNLADTHFSEEEMYRFVDDPAYVVLTLSAKDKYGDLGIVGFLIYKKTENTIISFSLSCRVLGRNFEYILLDQVKELSGKGLCGVYVDNGKNGSFSNFYEDNDIILTADSLL